ncbi:MAG: Spo0J and IME4 domain-containing protein [Pseudolabrys sp.]
MQYSPLANLFPMMSVFERAELRASLRDNGQREPIIFDEDGILDGRNRYEECLALGLTPRVRPYDPRPRPVGDGPDKVAFVLDRNLHRRQLDESQRAMVAARLATLAPGRPPLPQPEVPVLDLRRSGDIENPEKFPGLSQARAADRLNVTDRTLRKAKNVITTGVEGLQQAVDAGEMSVTLAEPIATLPKDRQAELLDSLPRDDAGRLTAEAKRAVRKVAAELRAEQTAEKKERRSVREREQGHAIATLPDERFGLIDADPEWRFIPYSTETGMDRAADNHYATSADDDIARRREHIDRIAAVDCALRLWVTDLARGIDTLRSWGFTYKSYWVWVKDIVTLDLGEDERRALDLIRKARGLHGDDLIQQRRLYMTVGAQGMGYWNTDRDELCLLGVRGNPVCPAPGTQGESVWFAPRGRHSEKPDVAYAWADRHFPHTPRIELNCRKRRPGWQAWGDECTPAPPGMVAFEREALVRGLIDANGMVRISDDHVVAFDFVTADEWRGLLDAGSEPLRRSA